MIFDLIGRIEAYHPRTALRAHLGRVLVLYVLNYLTLIVALFEKLDAIGATSHEPQPRYKRQMGDRNPVCFVNFLWVNEDLRTFRDHHHMRPETLRIEDTGWLSLTEQRKSSMCTGRRDRLLQQQSQ